ncbi:MAG: NOL1/NOP2/sun family putative RNA methylase [Candidatus Woesearchaeota archaeon]
MKEFFIERYKRLRPDFSEENIDLRPSLRVNTLKISHKALLPRMKKENVRLEKIDALSDGYNYSSSFSLGATPEYLMGYYYLQETASQMASEYLDPSPGELVLDMCSAPGSKTTHIAQLMKNEGVIIALEKKRHRIPSLKNNLERMGVSNTIVYNMDARDCASLGKTFDKILLDAPCSGNFVTDKDWFSKRDLTSIRTNSRTQRELLEAAVKVVKQGGIILYSTCSMEPEENEEVADWAVSKLGLEEVERRRFWPDIDNTQGFFISMLRKT